MKNTLLIIIGLVVGIITGGVLGFGIPFAIAQINPTDGTALSFLPIMTVPVGAVIGAIVGVILAAGQIKKNHIIEMNKSPETVPQSH